ncbi:uncharacterized protein LOC121861425 isoform X2 [Homarus americanus]|uniref:uncharacterized protein LOC121861425 isoform X2 n=1 Tax=Homarus americanus TaxID=6706 RepID=UPI001C4729A4|nr:uncharacterized protein LOC121861425 isoform X2 [Homarus americanus]
MSDKRGPPPASPYGAAAPNVSYAPMIATGAPPSYVESLSHQVVAGPGVSPQYPPPYVTPASAAAASAAQLQNYKDQIFAQTGQWYLADPMLIQSMAAAQQAQKLAYSQQAYQQQQTALYMQQQQQLYLQQLQGYYQPHPPPGSAAAAAGFQPGQNVLVMNGYDSGARFDGIAQPSIPPPPPGIAPNAAQLAGASGAQVSMTQKKGSFLTGGSGGGYTFF